MCFTNRTRQKTSYFTLTKFGLTRRYFWYRVTNELGLFIFKHWILDSFLSLPHPLSLYLSLSFFLCLSFSWRISLAIIPTKINSADYLLLYVCTVHSVSRNISGSQTHLWMGRLSPNVFGVFCAAWGYESLFGYGSCELKSGGA